MAYACARESLFKCPFGVSRYLFRLLSYDRSVDRPYFGDSLSSESIQELNLMYSRGPLLQVGAYPVFRECVLAKGFGR